VGWEFRQQLDSRHADLEHQPEQFNVLALRLRADRVQSGVSHLLLETAPTFTLGNISNSNVRSISVGTFGDEGNSNPYIPSTLYGIKFDNLNGTHVHITFDSDRAPMWGDFYAKGGKTGGTFNTVWDEGYAASNPLFLPANGTLSNHLLTPGAFSEIPTPEPLAATFLAIGAIGILYRSRRVATGYRSR